MGYNLITSVDRCTILILNYSVNMVVLREYVLITVLYLKIKGQFMYMVATS
jgi:hypothetical protein